MSSSGRGNKTHARNFPAISCNAVCHPAAAPSRTVSIIHMPYLDCMLNGVGML
jgi:hypothetical protein